MARTEYSRKKCLPCPRSERSPQTATWRRGIADENPSGRFAEFSEDSLQDRVEELLRLFTIQSVVQQGSTVGQKSDDHKGAGHELLLNQSLHSSCRRPVLWTSLEESRITFETQSSSTGTLSPVTRESSSERETTRECAA